MIIEIENLNNVKVFTELLIREGTNAHPGEDFISYVNMETGVDHIHLIKELLDTD